MPIKNQKSKSFSIIGLFRRIVHTPPGLFLPVEYFFEVVGLSDLVVSLVSAKCSEVGEFRATYILTSQPRHISIFGASLNTF